MNILQISLASFRWKHSDPVDWWWILACMPWDGHKKRLFSSCFGTQPWVNMTPERRSPDTLRGRAKLLVSRLRTFAPPRDSETICHNSPASSAYKVGERFIRKMRTMAETELKEKFDPRDFYDVVLLCGAVPLDVLEELVKEYIDKVTAGVSTTGGEATEIPSSDNFMQSMTFANWCKCCIVPGACQP
jgi:hypothetical protein